ncbi:MAG: DUF1822 family protein [Oscillatoriales cyanobacterium]|uniref:DUF1822 family protein n=1 Tax=Microcoleus anatoxicus PTRS2 TaxID=2705321 RepID=A0ABU8YQ01_9CYAN|nr:MAG: DUF1822 family protein [Oscillatoriales cyanobacterium]TAF69533.1 MAG: DUF1822 family protein [Oscillatoriales cyanobacterium]
MVNSMDTYLLEIPLEQTARNLALQFASEQANPQKGKRVYFNTLAVWAVNYFLEWMELETDIDGGDSWNPGMRAVLDVADLVLPGIGKIECCPVMLGETAISLPEVRENRIAYLAVQFAEPFDKVKLLGFIPAVEIVDETEAISLTNLQPIEELLDYLYRIELGIPVTQVLLEEELSDLEEDDPVKAQVREKLQNKSIAEIVAILNGVYGSSEKSDWGYEGGKALARIGASSGGLANRETSLSGYQSSDIDTKVEAKLNRIAKKWMKKLAEIWEDGDDFALS